ncbi:MAG: hypothetical protein COA63_014140 [Methylophaga sp.]|nr:hypothetical protein [Methylophaga sp.]
MSDIDNNEQVQEVDQLTVLKARASTMGITFSGNIGIDKLRAKIEEAQKPSEEKVAAVTNTLTKDQALRASLKKEQTALVRVRIANLNPLKRDLKGEFISVGNKYIGTIRKFIPFGEETDQGYHIEKILLTELKSRKFQSISTSTKGGKIKIDNRMVPEFSIEVLEPLTKEQLLELKTTQGAAERFES